MHTFTTFGSNNTNKKTGDGHNITNHFAKVTFDDKTTIQLFKDKTQNLYTEFENDANLDANAILTLLHTLSNFLYEATGDNTNKTENQISELLNDMGSTLKKFSALTVEPGYEKLHTSAVQYCNQCMNNLIHEMKNDKDKFYDVYNKTDNELKNIMAIISSSPSQQSPSPK